MVDVSTNEYGFYSNVNNNVDHPRWSQGTEDALGNLKTQNFNVNGYEEEVSICMREWI